MTKRVRDILINVGEGDLALTSEERKTLNYNDVIWGALFDDDEENVLYANVYVAPYNIEKLSADDDGRYIINFKSDYYPLAANFLIRLVTKFDDEYVKIEQENCAFPVLSAAYMGKSTDRIFASELFFIDSEGYYMAEMFFDNEKNKSYIYSAGNIDFNIGISDEQAAQLLSLCAPGKYYRYPISGIDITKYVNTIVKYTDFAERISNEFGDDNIDAQSVDFDSDTGKIDVLFNHEIKPEDDDNLVAVENLDEDIINVLDSDIENVDVDLEELDIDYSQIIFPIFIPNAILESCFANGVWMDEYPWTDDELWKDEE